MKSISVERGVSLALCLVVFSGCGKSTEQIGTLRVESVEIVDDKGNAKMNVADRINGLDQRVQKLEAALDKVREEQRAVPAVTVVAPSVTAPPAVASVAPVVPVVPVTPRPPSSARGAKPVTLGF